MCYKFDTPLAAEFTSVFAPLRWIRHVWIDVFLTRSTGLSSVPIWVVEVFIWIHSSALSVLIANLSGFRIPTRSLLTIRTVLFQSKGRVISL